LTFRVLFFSILQYKINDMPQVIDLKKEKVAERSNIEKKEEKPKTKFQQEWENAIPADKAFDDLLTHVRGLWKK
jgi:hypothetical protein